MVLAALSGFVVPQRYTERVEPQLQSLFWPVAKPARWVAGAVGRQLDGPEAVDLRPMEAVLRQNDDLAQANAQLAHEVERLQKLNSDRESMGSLQSFCTPVPVISSDLANHESLELGGSSLSGLKSDMCVLYSGGVVGKFQVTGLGGGKVQLITNKDFKVTAYFCHVDPESRPHSERLNKEPFLIAGDGKGGMICNPRTMAEIKAWKVKPGDWVMLEDSDWPRHMQGMRLGTVLSIDQNPRLPLFAEVHVRPAENLKHLKQVMVLTRN